MSTTAVGLEHGLPSHRRFPTLDGYRAIAALMVLTTHVAFTSGLVWQQPWLGAITSRLDGGVTVFFLLSGFLLYRPWALAAMTGRSGPGLARFWWRRAMRIFPAYWAMVCFTLLLLPEIQPVGVQVWATYLPLVHIYLPQASVEGLTQIWSLATEVAFYAVLPLLARLAGRAGRGDPDRSARAQLVALALVAAGSWAFTVARAAGGLGNDLNVAYWLPGFLDWFAIGMAFAVVSARLSLPGPPRMMSGLERLADDVPTCLAAAGLVFLVVCTPLGGPYAFELGSSWTTVLKHLLYGVAAALLLAPGLLGHPDRGRWRHGLMSRPMVWLGTISYGIFLWHLVLLRLTLEVLDWPPFGGRFLALWIITVALSAAVAWLSWKVLEAPLQRLSHRWPPARRPRATTAGQPATR